MALLAAVWSLGQIEPLRSKCHVTITGYQTRKDWALQIIQMHDERYPDAVKVRLGHGQVQDSPRSANSSRALKIFVFVSLFFFRARNASISSRCR